MSEADRNLVLIDPKGNRVPVADVVYGDEVDENGDRWVPIAVTIPFRNILPGSTLQIVDAAHGDKLINEFTAFSISMHFKGEAFARIDGRQRIAPSPTNTTTNVTASIPLPLFAYLLKDASGAVYFRVGPDTFLPLFTSLENAQLFGQRAKMECLAVELPLAADVASFLRNPPSRSSQPNNFKVMIDPVSPEVGEYHVFDRSALISALDAAS